MKCKSIFELEDHEDNKRTRLIAVPKKLIT